MFGIWWKWMYPRHIVSSDQNWKIMFTLLILTYRQIQRYLSHFLLSRQQLLSWCLLLTTTVRAGLSRFHQNQAQIRFIRLAAITWGKEAFNVLMVLLLLFLSSFRYDEIFSSSQSVLLKYVTWRHKKLLLVLLAYIFSGISGVQIHPFCHKIISMASITHYTAWEENFWSPQSFIDQLHRKKYP